MTDRTVSRIPAGAVRMGYTIRLFDLGGWEFLTVLHVKHLPGDDGEGRVLLSLNNGEVMSVRGDYPVTVLGSDFASGQ